VLVEYVTTAIDIAQGPRPGYAARAQYRDVYLDNPVPYDSTFRQRQTILVLPVAVKQALYRAATPAPAGVAGGAVIAASSAVPVRRPSRLRYGYLVGSWPVAVAVAVAGSAEQVGFAPVGSGFQALGSSTLRAQSTTYWYVIFMGIMLWAGCECGWVRAAASGGWVVAAGRAAWPMSAT